MKIYTISEADSILKPILIGSTPSLFLGAGFSKGADNKLSAATSSGLKEQIIHSFYDHDALSDADKKDLENYNLRKLCDDVYTTHGNKDQLYDFLTDSFINTNPAEFHYQLMSYPWRKIYTVNIDDLVENIYASKGISITVQNHKSKIEPIGDIELFKLHGCVHNKSDGYVFSEREYIDQINSDIDFKFNEFSHEITKNNVIFIGASMDEPDIISYLGRYENAGYSLKSNKIIFISPKPDRQLKQMATKLNAILIDATAEDFLNYIKALNYQPNKIEAAIRKMAYNGIHRLLDIESTYEYPYESRLYNGDYCKWQDVKDGWTFTDENTIQGSRKLENLLSKPSANKCFCIIGPVFSGKSCTIKQIAYNLFVRGYEVLEHRGNYFDRDSFLSYVHVSVAEKIALLIDNGSYYYNQIEKLLETPIEGKELLIIVSSREYYHKRKRYYLEGNCFEEFLVEAEFNADDAKRIEQTLSKKSHLSFFATQSYNQRIREIINMRDYINLIFSLTYGKIKNSPLRFYKKNYNTLDDTEKNLLLELTIFDIADIDCYPKELLLTRFGSLVNGVLSIDANRFPIADFIRCNERGISTRNPILNLFIKKNNKEKIGEVIVSLLQTIAINVSEKNNDNWYFIFQRLLKNEVLSQKYNLNVGQIRKIYLSVKTQYEGISYYWLQLGLFEQNQEDYPLAFTYLNNSAAIRPNSYKIQHALARNYLRFANNQVEYEKAKVLFAKGEQLMRELIESKEYRFAKAKPFSIHSYVIEKIKYHRKFDVEPDSKDLRYIQQILEGIKNSTDKYIQDLYGFFYKYLFEIGKTSILRFDINSPYVKYICEIDGKAVIDNLEEDVDFTE